MRNPLSWLVVAASLWILVLGVNQPWLSALIFILAQAFALIRLRNFSVLAATLALVIPVSLSMLLVHAPFGEEPLLPLITADGLRTAAELCLRFLTLMSAFLAAATAVTVPELVKAVQGNRWLGHRLAYVIGSAVHLLPQGREALATVREANQLRGRNTRRPIHALRFIALPLITRLLNTGAARAIPLEVAGMDHPGTRTVLRPVPDSRVERIIRWLLPLAAMGVALCL